MQRISFCPLCGHELEDMIPPGDFKERQVCLSCQYIHYKNPKVLVSCFATHGAKALWMRRTTEPRRGFWTIPSGFMEDSETPEEGAARELFEETRGRVDPSSLALLSAGSLPDISEVHLTYRGVLLNPDEIQVTEEASEVALFAVDEVPWGDLAYEVVGSSTKKFYADHERGVYGVYTGSFGSRQSYFSEIRRDRLVK
jgi:ADP-ribose pyrophosphatase YjhB (NUDIX family)